MPIKVFKITLRKINKTVQNYYLQLNIYRITNNNVFLHNFVHPEVNSIHFPHTYSSSSFTVDIG